MRTLALAIFLTVATSSCAMKPLTVHAGAVNRFDSVTYDTLVATQAALEEASAQVGKFPAIKPALNQAIDAYNVAERLYKDYHAAALAGKTQDTEALATAVAAVSADALRLIAQIQKGTN